SLTPRRTFSRPAIDAQPAPTSMATTMTGRLLLLRLGDLRGLLSLRRGSRGTGHGAGPRARLGNRSRPGN
ncbi:hypothetical protein, partial [Streptosporangium sandarakinum]|uniref:hypothetical protein n=1 Tax=Streptosporangium sandarakinum TaxID=1260955 RepID=UPI0033B6AE9B